MDFLFVDGCRAPSLAGRGRRVPPEEKLVKRVALFVLTNLAVLLVIGTLLQLLGVQGILDEHGVGIDVPSLLLLSLVVGMGGS
jgi:hypothetical protein